MNQTQLKLLDPKSRIDSLSISLTRCFAELRQLQQALPIDSGFSKKIRGVAGPIDDLCRSIEDREKDWIQELSSPEFKSIVKQFQDQIGTRGRPIFFAWNKRLGWWVPVVEVGEHLVTWDDNQITRSDPPSPSYEISQPDEFDWSKGIFAPPQRRTE